MLKDREIELMQPWSPMLMRTRMLDSEVQAFLKITDKVINNVNSESWGHKLAGQIKTELKIEHQDLMQETIEGISAFDVILEYVKEYYGYSNAKAKVALDILDKKQLNLIKDKLDKGGRKR